MRDQSFDKFAAAGFKMIRINPDWSAFEPQKGSYNATYTAKISACIDAARSRGMGVILTQTSTPSWALTSGGDWRSPPSNIQDFGNYCSWSASQFGSRVSAIEVWNEQNSTHFFTGTNAQYVEMLKSCYTATKAQVDVPVLVGGLAYVDHNYMQQMYANGAKGYFDAANVHPYNDATAPEDPCYVASDGRGHRLTCIPMLREVMLNNGDDKPIWNTEFGWRASENGEAQQADYAVRAYKYMRANYPYVPVASWYRDMSQPGATDASQTFGLLYSDLSERPVLGALRNYFTGG
jgi:hypothetical protein